jgi:hypothetical protein
VTVEVVGSVVINPAEIEHCLQLADFQYPKTRETEQFAGWASTPAIPALYNLTVKRMQFPLPDTGVAFLLQNVDLYTDSTDPRIINRAQKLYMDFCRDMHALGLLQKCPLFGYIQYQKSLDISYNVDYVTALLLQLGGGQVGIQSAMRAVWRSNDYWSGVKAGRRLRRNIREWDGPLYWLTNKTRPPAKKINKCWLFGPTHINELAEEIRGSKIISSIGVQLALL